MSSVPPINPPPPPPPPRPRAAAGLTEDQWAETWHYACVHAQARMPLLYTVKRWFTSKLIWFGKGVAFIGACLEYLQGQERHVLGMFGVYGPPAFIAIGLAVIALRFVTSGKLTK